MKAHNEELADKIATAIVNVLNSGLEVSAEDISQAVLHVMDQQQADDRLERIVEAEFTETSREKSSLALANQTCDGAVMNSRIEMKALTALAGRADHSPSCHCREPDDPTCTCGFSKLRREAKIL